MEALLSFRYTRLEVKSALLKRLESDWTLPTSKKWHWTRAVEMVNFTLQAGENGTIARRASESASSHLSIFQNEPDLSSTMESLGIASPGDGIAEEMTLRESKESSGDEMSWRERQLPRFTCTGASNLIDLSDAFKKLGQKVWQVVGFANDARSVFFISDRAVCIFDMTRHRSDPIVYKQDRRDTSRIKIGALTQSFLVLVKVHNSVSTIVVKRLHDQVTAIEWSPEGGQIRVAIAHESAHFLFILLAQGNGQICIYRLDGRGRVPWPTHPPLCRLQVDQGDYVKHISTSPRYDSIAALTHRNVLWVWPIGLDFPGGEVDSFRYSHGYYNPV